MGMFAVDDMAGLDVAWRVRQELGHFSDPGVRRPLVADQLDAMGRYGQKTGKGWYRYGRRRRRPHADPRPGGGRPDRALGDAKRASRGATITDEEIVERAIYALINEGARVLEDGGALRASDIDVIYVNGYGFPGVARRPDVLRRSRRPAPRSTTASRRSIASTARAGRRRRCSRGSRARAARSASSTPSGRSAPPLRTGVTLVASAAPASDTLGSVRSTPSSTAAPTARSYVRSPHALGPYPAKITERLEHWADAAPVRERSSPQRDADGAWRALTYADALARVRRIAQALLDRGLSAERPIVILSGNSIEHGLLALAAMYVGVPYAPIAPAYSLHRARLRHAALPRASRCSPGSCSRPTARRSRTRCAPSCDGVEIVVASVVDRQQHVIPSERQRVDSRPAGRLDRSTPFAELEATPATAAVDAAHARVGPDTIAKILFTSGSTGRPKGVINTQRMLCANQEMMRTVMRVPRRRAAGALRLAAVEPHLRRQPQLRPRALQRRHAVHRRGQADAGGVRGDGAQPARDRARPRTSTCRAATRCCVPHLRADAGCARASSAG